MSTNSKSDVKAKNAFCEYLNNNGFTNAHVVSSPADIEAYKNGQQWYFEIKMTHRQDGLYFGAATLTEWVQAIKDPAHFRFVVVILDENDNVVEFKEYTPEEFMDYSTIPPFKIFFNLPLGKVKQKRRNNRTAKAIRLTKDYIKILNDVFTKMKEITK